MFHIRKNSRSTFRPLLESLEPRQLLSGVPALPRTPRSPGVPHALVKNPVTQPKGASGSANKILLGGKQSTGQSGGSFVTGGGFFNTSNGGIPSTPIGDGILFKGVNSGSYNQATGGNSGTLVLTGSNNTYTGQINIHSGVLLFINTSSSSMGLSSIIEGTGSLAGDVNGDGVVNIIDFSIIAGHLQSSTTSGTQIGGPFESGLTVQTVGSEQKTAAINSLNDGLADQQS